jgi:DegV family protein with EDD domain
LVRIVTESTADIPAELAAKLDIDVVPSYVIFGSESYRDGVELTKEQFYERLSAVREVPKTATPPPATYEEVYRRLAAETTEIVSIHLAASLSGLYNAASVATQSVPEAQIVVIDSEQVTMGYGLMAVAAAEAAQQGATLEEVVGLIEGMKDRSRVLAVLDTLEFLYRGGRVGWAQAALGTLMQIKPIIEVQRGEVRLVERARTRARSFDRLVGMIRELGPLERAIVLHADAPQRAEQLADQVQALHPEWDRLVGHAGVTIASHTGPGALGIACVTTR